MSEESIGIDGVGNLMPAVRSLVVKHKAGQTGTGGFYSDIHIAVGKNPIRHEDGSGGNRVVEGNVVGFPEPQLRHRLHWFQHRMAVGIPEHLLSLIHIFRKKKDI